MVQRIQSLLANCVVHIDFGHQCSRPLFPFVYFRVESILLSCINQFLKVFFFHSLGFIHTKVYRWLNTFCCVLRVSSWIAMMGFNTIKQDHLSESRRALDIQNRVMPIPNDPRVIRYMTNALGRNPWTTWPVPCLTHHKCVWCSIDHIGDRSKWIGNMDFETATEHSCLIDKRLILDKTANIYTL